MMFEMLAGERPFRAESLDLLLARHMTAPTPALPPAHAALQPVVERLMAKRPEDRYASAAGPAGRPGPEGAAANRYGPQKPRMAR